MKHELLYDLCHSASTIAAEVAKHPDHSVDQVVRRMRKQWRSKSLEGVKKRTASGSDTEKDRLDRAAACGKFPYRPSDLFLKVYADVLDSLCHKPFANLVSPSLVGTSGVVPLSVVSVIPDIIRHYADLIAHAQHEVFLATNYWERSYSAALICGALCVLSKRGIQERRRNEEKVVVKIVYDRGTPSQVIRNHAPVPPEKWESVGLPRPEDVKGIRMEVVNYHRPPLGTFHAKYLVVDRKIACINSNNVQDRPNVEMCLHLEGPIVESFYDAALFSWANRLDPPLPLLKRPLTQRDEYKFGDENEHLKYIDSHFAGEAALTLIEEQQEREAQQLKNAELHVQRNSDSGDGSLFAQVLRAAAKIPGPDEGVHGKDELVGQHPAMSLPNGSDKSELGTAGNGEAESNESLARNRQTGGNVEGVRLGGSTDGYPSGHDLDQLQGRQRDHADSRSSEFVIRASDPSSSTYSSFSSSYTNSSDASMGPGLLRSGKNSFASSRTSSRVEAITMHLNGFRLQTNGTIDDDDDMDDFQPHIMHAPHEPVPIAMVNRLPRGTPGHESVRGVPQNVAWLSLLKNAKKSVFIQTPTFNASPVIPAVLDACRRGVEVTLYLDLGFNDLGEMIPFQGGTNEQVTHAMYKVLNKEGKADNLKVYWYTAKDQKEPVSATRKTRNCHTKFMAVDSQVTMVGNGNHDTQSWFHSQEINLMIDSAQLTREWLEGIDANQNTGKFGKVDTKDGIWRAPDGSGRVVQSSGVKKPGPMDGLRGVASAVRRARGV